MPRAPAALLLLLGGCGFADANPSWVDQPSPSGPCYDANLLDGLDEASTAEIHSIFACVNSTGTLNAFAPLDLAMDGSTRDGSIGHLLAVQVNSLKGTQFSVTRILDTTRDLLDQRGDWQWLLPVALELVYAAPYSQIGVDIPFNDSDALNHGLLGLWSEPVGLATTAILDDQLRALVPVTDALRSPQLARAAWTLALLPQSTDPNVSRFADRWAFDLSDAIARSSDSSNNHSQRINGNSLQDLADAVLVQTGDDGRLVLAHLSDPLLPLLESDIAEASLRSWISAEYTAGRLAVLPGQLLHLADVDIAGNPLPAGPNSSPSALEALIRLLHRGNRDIVCEGDIIGIPFSFDLGNLSVALLGAIAQQSPQTADSAVDLLGSVLGVDWLTGPVLDLVPGVCPAIDQEMIDDLYALDRLNDPAVSGLLVALIEALQALQPWQQQIIDLLSVADEYTLVPPAEEALRDLADGPLVADLLGLVPLLLEPQTVFATDAFPAGIQPLALEDVWQLLLTVLQVDSAGLSPLDRLSPPIQALIAEDGSWQGLQALGLLLGQSDAETTKILPRLEPVLQKDPTLSFAPDLATLLEDPDKVTPLLILVESRDLRQALLSTTPEMEGPLPFMARIEVSGTLDQLLNTIDVLLSIFPEDG